MDFKLEKEEPRAPCGSESCDIDFAGEKQQKFTELSLPASTLLYHQKRSQRKEVSIGAALLVSLLVMSWLLGWLKTPWTTSSAVEAGKHTGARMRLPELVKVQHLNQELLPGKKSSRGRDKRVIIVGDVHGCRNEREFVVMIS